MNSPLSRAFIEALPLVPNMIGDSYMCMSPNGDEILKRILAVTLGTNAGMGLGAGGTMKQEIYADPWEPGDWQESSSQRVWVHLCDATCWQAITGEPPMQKASTASDYTRAGLPWHDYCRDDMNAIEGSPALARLKSVFAAAKEKGDHSIPQEDSVEVNLVKAIGPHAPANKVVDWDGK